MTMIPLISCVGIVPITDLLSKEDKSGIVIKEFSIKVWFQLYMIDMDDKLSDTFKEIYKQILLNSGNKEQLHNQINLNMIEEGHHVQTFCDRHRRHHHHPHWYQEAA